MKYTTLLKHNAILPMKNWIIQIKVVIIIQEEKKCYLDVKPELVLRMDQKLFIRL